MRGGVKMLVLLAVLVVVVPEITPVVDGETRKLLMKDNGKLTDHDVDHVDNFFGGLGGLGGLGVPGAGGLGGTGAGSGIFPHPGTGGIGVPGIGPVEFCSFPGLGCVHVEPTNPGGGLGGQGGGFSPPLPFP